MLLLLWILALVVLKTMEVLVSVFSLRVGRSYSMVELLHVFAVMVATSIFRTGDVCLGHVPMRLFLMSPPSCHLQCSDFHALVDDSPSSPYEPATET